MKAESLSLDNPDSLSRADAYGQAPDCISQARRTIFFLACRSHWTFVIFATSWRLLKQEASAGRLIGLEFRNRVFHSKCGIWKQAFEWFCFSAGGSEFCSR